MLRDVFYYGKKPNVHPRERYAKNLKDARQQSRSEHFWIINEYCDYKNFEWEFDFDLLPDEDVWAQDHNNVWPSQHQKDSGTWLCSKKDSEIIIYRNDVDTVHRKNIKSNNWKIIQKIDETKFNFSWHPDPTEPPYIYVFPTIWNQVGGPQFVVEGATQKKYITSQIATPISTRDNWKIPSDIDVTEFDFTWVPHPEDPPYIYQFGTQWQKDGGPQYIVQGAKEIKYVDVQKATATPTTKNWAIPKNVDVSGFDFSWHPDDISSPYIYQFGTQWQKTGGPRYVVEGATEIKYIDITKAKALPNKSNFKVLIDIDEVSFDYSWHPDENDDPYIYVFGNQWHNAEIEPTVEYRVRGATEKKYINNVKVNTLADMTCWKINYPIHVTKFDFTWRPDPGSPPYIYVFGSNLYPAEEMSCLEYHVQGATDYKYVPNIVAELAPDKTNWIIPDNVDITDFDFSWHPNPKDPAYIYYAGTQWQKTGGPRYVVKGATEIKYLENKKVKALPTKDKWTLPPNVDFSDFDFSWHPDDTEPPYIYQFGTQWALTGGPKYVMPEATEIKYMDSPIARALPDKTNWIVPDNIDSSSFDFSWHPYVEDQPYIYVFGTQWQKTGGPRYVTPGADEMSPVKYIDRRILKSKRLSDRRNWEIPANIDPDTIDYTWHPDDTEQPYIYEFGTQWHDRGGPKYVVPDATAMKYSSDIKGELIKERDNWEILTPIVEDAFDFSWHPHPNDPPFIYVFGNNLYPAEEMETVRYVVPEATQVKYVNDLVATLAEDKTNWEIPEDVDVSDFDFTWKPHPKAPSYIYEFGTQWQKTGGPRYVVPGAKEVNYISGSKAVYKPKITSKYWEIPDSLDISEFDFSWHPDRTEKAYIYQFGTQWAMSGGPRYVVPGATEIKYMDNPVAKMKPNKSNWDIPADIDIDSFDFSWHPYIEDQAYIYQFGTQWQKTGGPRYVTPGADEMSPVKYIDRRILKAKKLPNKNNFTVLGNHSIADFDYSWHPDDTEPPYIYVFGNDKYSAEVMPTLQFIVHEATKTKYVLDVVAKLSTNKTNWKITQPIDETKFDFSWIPHPNDPPYIYRWGNKYISNKYKATIEYIVPGAKELKYMTDDVEVLPEVERWVIPKHIDKQNFDFTWRPDPLEPDYIWEFGTQWQKNGGPRYVMPGATEVKYIDSQTATRTSNPSDKNWQEIIPVREFDWSWHPDSTDEPYIYIFGNSQYPAEIMPTIKYVVPGATKIKYVHDVVAKLKPSSENWNEIISVDKSKFDYSWVPDPTSPPYIYVFGNQWNKAEIEPTIEYKAQGATEYKYIQDIVASVLPNKKNWKVHIPVDKSFDFSWRPNPKDPPYIYVFGNQWNKAEKEPTVEYIVSGATDKKYIQDIVANVAENLAYWKIPEGVDTSDFDFTWRPDAGAPPYIYQFGTLSNDNDGPIYHTPDNTGEIVRLQRVYKKVSRDILSIGKYYITTTLSDLADQHPNELFWALRENIDYTNFDFDWRPNIEQARYVHVFGSPDAEMTQTYFVSGSMWKEGHRDYNYVQQETKADTEYLAELFVQPDIFLVDRGNPETQARFEQLKARFTNVSKTRFLNSWVDTINRCINRSNTEVCWILNSELDYSNFDFKYYPNPWQMKMVHVFGTQWSHWGTTFMVNRDTFTEDTKYIKIIEHLSNLNFVKDRRAIATNNLYDIIVINHGNKECDKVVGSLEVRASGKKVTTVDYDTSYVNTLKNIVNNLNAKKEQFVWITSSICSYGEFDFTYICDPFAKDSLHVFPSDRQKFGDTFLLDVNKAKEAFQNIELLQQYPKVNYNQTIRAKRLSAPIIKTGQDTHVEAVKSDFDFPYAIFQTEDITTVDNEPMNLWAPDTKSILITSTGGTRIIVPKEAKEYVKDQLYDYPYIKTASKLLDSKPLDIVFLSNGEKCAEENYEHLLAVTKGLKNRVVRIDGINGRVDAYHAAVKASQTNWAFTVFAKLKVDSKFDFSWQPDRLQMPKHYIFHAKNPVNGLEYGHQGMIAYNKALTLNNFGDGLDFTLDDPHETIEILSGIATFNTDAYSTWRTSFREVIKLKSDYTDISQKRLKVWLTKAKGKFAKDCLQGANDAVEYYNQVNGDIDQLKQSYEWVWLVDYYNRKYK